MIWDASRPIQQSWNAGAVAPEEVLYEFDGPTIFTKTIGLARFLFFKKDEFDDSELFLVVPVSNAEIDLLRSGRLSVRGVLSHREAWLVQTSPDYKVEQFQELSSSLIESLLPPKGLALRASLGVVPDSIEQAHAFMTFKFTGPSMSVDSMPLSVFKGLFDNVSELVRKALLPRSLMEGRNNRFFDVQIGEPKFASLLITIQNPEIDEQALREYKPTKDLVPQTLRDEAAELGQELWNSIEKSASLAIKGELNRSSANLHHLALEQISGILPSVYNDLQRLEVSFHGNHGLQIVSIDREIGNRLIRAESFSGPPTKTLTGVIVEVNGEAGTFIIKDVGERQTTCAPTAEVFREMERAGSMRRGQRLRVRGSFWKRKRRDYISLDVEPEML